MTFLNTHATKTTFFIMLFISQQTLTMEEKETNQQIIAQAMTNHVMAILYEKNHVDPICVTEEIVSSTETQTVINNLLNQNFKNNNKILLQELLQDKETKK